MNQTPNHHIEIEACSKWGYDCIHFRATTGDAAATRPPVRIFLGTEASQWRAERVFLWSVTRFGDPARDYEVHRMADLSGFDPRRWTTGFTLYRFAIPTLAGATGRAMPSGPGNQIRACRSSDSGQQSPTSPLYRPTE